MDMDELHGTLAESARVLTDRLIGLSTDPQIPPDTRQAAVSIILRLAPQPDVLLMVRAVDARDPWSGQVSLPGGHRDPQDASLVDTARRETLEEVGLDLAKVALPLGFLEPMQARARGKIKPLLVTPVVFLQHSEGSIELGPEASHAFRLPVRPLLAGDLDVEHRIERDAQVHRHPAWSWEQRTIWGMTHHILKQCFTKVHDLPEFAPDA